MESKAYKIVELAILFVLIPLGLVTPVNPPVKVVVCLAGLAYCIGLMLRMKLITRTVLFHIPKAANWKTIGLRFFGLVVITLTYMVFLDPENMLIVVRKKPALWVMILFVYSFLSVYPQELIYRTFFIERYSSLFKSDKCLILVNSVLFCAAHAVFQNTLVLLLTLIGGFIFALTYNKTKSLLFVSIEHSLYGCWLFTVGMGEMLAFPMP